jgi:hypothetical protein
MRSANRRIGNRLGGSGRARPGKVAHRSSGRVAQRGEHEVLAWAAG